MPYINNNGVRIHYEVEGNTTGQPLLMQHGFAATRWTWRDFGYARELGKDYQLILVDARGHGESDKPHDPSSYRPEVVARDYITILDNMGIEKTHYIGYSMGARIGLLLARYAMPRLHSLILGGVSFYRRPAGEVSRRDDNFTRMLLEAAERGMDVWLSQREKMLGIHLTPAQRARQLANDPKALLAAREAFAEWPDNSDLLPKITVPTLIFMGEADPPYERAKEAAKIIPKATFVSFPGLNHDATLMHSELVIPHVKKFLGEASRG